MDVVVVLPAAARPQVQGEMGSPFVTLHLDENVCFAMRRYRLAGEVGDNLLGTPDKGVTDPEPERKERYKRGEVGPVRVHASMREQQQQGHPKQQRTGVRGPALGEPLIPPRIQVVIAIDELVS